jgi:hypothetical protein
VEIYVDSDEDGRKVRSVTAYVYREDLRSIFRGKRVYSDAGFEVEAEIDIDKDFEFGNRADVSVAIEASKESGFRSNVQRDRVTIFIPRNLEHWELNMLSKKPVKLSSGSIAPSDSIGWGSEFYVNFM